MVPQTNSASHSTQEAPSQLHQKAAGLCIEVFKPNCPTGGAKGLVGYGKSKFLGEN